MNKWEADEHKQWSEKVRSHHFCPPLLDKTKTMKGTETIINEVCCVGRIEIQIEI